MSKHTNKDIHNLLNQLKDLDFTDCWDKRRINDVDYVSSSERYDKINNKLKTILEEFKSNNTKINFDVLKLSVSVLNYDYYHNNFKRFINLSTEHDLRLLLNYLLNNDIYQSDYFIDILCEIMSLPLTPKDLKESSEYQYNYHYIDYKSYNAVDKIKYILYNKWDYINIWKRYFEAGFKVDIKWFENSLYRLRHEQYSKKNYEIFKIICENNPLCYEHIYYWISNFIYNNKYYSLVEDYLENKSIVVNKYFCKDLANNILKY